MMRKLGLLNERQLEEEALIAKVPDTQPALERLAAIYGDLKQRHPTSFTLETARGVFAGSTLMATGHTLHEFDQERSKPDDRREATYRTRNRPFLARRLAQRLEDVHVPHEVALLQDVLEAVDEGLPEVGPKLREILGDDLTKTVKDSPLLALKREALETLLNVDENDTTTTTTTLPHHHKDPFVQCAAALWKIYERERDADKAALSERDVLLARLLDAQRTVGGSEVFYPDCNGSLRLSAGYVEGYQAADAVRCEPQTTLAGLWDKVLENELSGSDVEKEFICPDRLADRLKSGGEDLQVPVCLLYSTDTVGGNSGSPVMNADGEFVAINFDRQRQGLLNEFKWSKDYSRSIGTDVRYILWLVGEYDGAKELVDEMLS